MPLDDPPALRPDKELIAAALAGDGEAFRCIVQRHKPPLMQMARRILGQDEEAEDALQDAFMQAHNHLAGFRGDSKLSTWLYSIALNRVRNHLRWRGKHRMVSMDGEPEEGAPAMELLEKGPALDEAAAQRGESVRLRQAVDGLQEDFRSIFVLHYYQHLSLEEVARRVAKPVGTVRVYLHRARLRLRAVLAADPTGVLFPALPAGAAA